MVLQLHVWGPAYGLPSLDPECLTMIAYFTQALDQSEWTIVHSSPSAIPTRRLPSLYNPATQSWTAGLTSILSHLVADPPPSFRNSSAGLSPSDLATTTAFTTYLRTKCPQLLSLSLYASSANWSSVTRSAYTTSLPFPLGWTEVLPIRRSWISLSSGLGIDLADAEDAESQLDNHHDGPQRGPNGKIRSLLTPEQKARISLESLVVDTLLPLAKLKGDKKYLLTDGDAGPTLLDCVAFGYLALMICPDVPRPWLRDTVDTKFRNFRVFVKDLRTLCFGKGLPVAADTPREGVSAVASRFADGVVRNVPWLGEQWRRWRDERVRFVDGLLIAGGGLAVVAIVAGFVFRRRITLPVLGMPVHVWEMPRRGLPGFGAAGAMFFGSAYSPGVSFGGAERGQDGMRAEVQTPFRGKADGIEVDVAPSV